jgi:hypothetical protein
MTVENTISTLTVLKDTYHAYVPSFVGKLDMSDVVLAMRLVMALMAMRAMYRYSLVHMVSDRVPLHHPLRRISPSLGPGGHHSRVLPGQSDSCDVPNCADRYQQVRGLPVIHSMIEFFESGARSKLPLIPFICPVDKFTLDDPWKSESRVKREA